MESTTEIIGFHPRTISVRQDPITHEWIKTEDSRLLSDLPEMIQNFVKLWITMKIRARKTPNYSSTSYGLKHILENEFGIYLTNNQFKDAMYMMGHYPTNEKDLNWYFRIDNVVDNHPRWDKTSFMNEVLRPYYETENKEEK